MQIDLLANVSMDQIELSQKSVKTKTKINLKWSFTLETVTREAVPKAGSVIGC